MFCPYCGKEISDAAAICLNCGCAVHKSKTTGTHNEKTNEKQLAFIFGIVGIVAAWIFALVGHIFSIIGIVYGVKEYKECENASGLTMSIVGEVCSVFSSLIGIGIMTDLF